MDNFVGNLEAIVREMLMGFVGYGYGLFYVLVKIEGFC